MLETVQAVATPARRGHGGLPGGASGLVYEAGGRRLIDGIDLHIAAGLITVVMGPNGSGKSLLLRLLHGLIAPTSGEVRWGGRSPDGVCVCSCVCECVFCVC